MIAGRGGSRIRLAASHAPAFSGAKPEISAPDVTTPPRRGREHPRGPLGTPTPAFFCGTDWGDLEPAFDISPARTRRIPAPHDLIHIRSSTARSALLNIVRLQTCLERTTGFFTTAPAFSGSQDPGAGPRPSPKNVVPLLTRRFIVSLVFLRNNLQPLGCNAA